MQSLRGIRLTAWGVSCGGTNRREIRLRLVGLAGVGERRWGWRHRNRDLGECNLERS